MANIEQLQRASARVEERMRAFLMQWTPAQELKLGDVLLIAREARSFAFEEFHPESLDKRGEG